MRCEACKHWEQGECHKHPPMVVSMKMPEPRLKAPYQMTDCVTTRWPKTNSWQGCGEGEA